MLHTINKSPFEKNTLETCLRLADDGASILYIEDGVYSVVKNTKFDLNNTLSYLKLGIFLINAINLPSLKSLLFLSFIFIA